MAGADEWYANVSNEVPPFSSLGVPAAAGMYDWYENSLACLQSGSQTRLSSESWNPEGVGWGKTTIPCNNAGVPPFSYFGVPAAAGMRDCHESGLPPANSSIPAKAGIPEGWRGTSPSHA